MGIHFLTFAGEFTPHKYTYAAMNQARLAQEFHLFDSFTLLTQNHLANDSEFQRHFEFILQNKRGFGYWLWKSYIIYKHLSSLKEGDILLYADACTYLNAAAKDKFLDYIEIVKKNKDGNLWFEYSNIISHWCKMDTLIALNGEHLLNEKEVVPGVLFTTANQKNIEFFKKIYQTSCNYHLIDDSPSVAPNAPEFHEHRHDQSVFSICARLYMPDSISTNPNSDDINFYQREHLRDQYPIWIQSNFY